MVPIKVCVENFMCYRDRAEFNFDGAPLWILTGKNGAGKSSVFDAITFVLYGFHRFGKSKHHELINKKSAHGMVVEFDFTVDNKFYRVKRTYTDKGRPTFQASEFVDGYDDKNLKSIPGTDKKEGLEDWVITNIGLDEKAFSAAILLRQGDADALLKADPSKRHPILSQIVNLSKYERLHTRTDERCRKYEHQYNSVQSTLQRIPPVDLLQIESLAQEIQQAEVDVKNVNENLEKLIELKVHAQNWGNRIAEKRSLENKIDLAEQLLEQRQQIEEEAAEAEELKTYLPIFEDLYENQKRLISLSKSSEEYTELNSQIEEIQASLKKIETVRDDFPSWKRYCEERENWHQATAEITKLENILHDLTSEITGLESEENKKRNLLAEAENNCTKAREAFDRTQYECAEAKKKNERFSKLEGKTQCDWCGLELTEKHRVLESQKLINLLHETEENKQKMEYKFKQAQEEWQIQNKEHQEILENLKILRRDSDHETFNLRAAVDKQAKSITAATQSFSSISETARKPLEAFGDIKTAFTQAFPTKDDLSNLEGQTQLYKEQQGKLDKLRTDQREIAPSLGQLEEVKARISKLELALTEEHLIKAQGLAENDLAILKARVEKLAGASRKLTDLKHAIDEQEARKTRLKETIIAIEKIDKNAHRPASIIEDEIVGLRQKGKTTYVRQRELEIEKQNSENQQQRRQELEGERKEIQHKFALYKELSKLFGRDFLQRWLLREAEKTIVNNANHFLERVSSRSIQLILKSETDQDGNSDKGAKALELMANYTLDTQDDDYIQVPVDALSGGQRFRVAVSLALGIGQYASTGTCRLESVIIDEGFGSLDSDGRKEMIEELKSLKDELKRIIVVSHQDEVAQAFQNNKYIIENNNGSSQVTLVY